MKNLKLAFTFIICLFANSLIAQNWNPSHPSWTDSYEANGFCWCGSTNFDHGLNRKTLRLNGTNYNIVNVCDELEKHPSYRAFRNGDAPYNDIQCGNGPANDAADETGCPGRTDLGPGGCNNTGRTFDIRWLESRSRFGSNSGGSTIVQIRKRNASNFAIDGGRGGENGQNVYMWTQNAGNINQQWVEIDRGNGFYSYQKRGTNFCIDGNRGGSDGQNLYLWECSTSNQNQHWKKVSTSGGAFRLEKRNSPSYSLDGNGGGENGQNVYLWTSSNNNQNQQWIITPVGSAKSIVDSIETDDVVVYPNPFVDVLNVLLNDDRVNDEITYRISDLAGRTLSKKVSKDKIQEFYINTLEPGMYLLEINAGTKNYIKKILKK